MNISKDLTLLFYYQRLKQLYLYTKISVNQYYIISTLTGCNATPSIPFELTSGNTFLNIITSTQRPDSSLFANGARDNYTFKLVLCNL